VIYFKNFVNFIELLLTIILNITQNINRISGLLKLLELKLVLVCHFLQIRINYIHLFLRN